MGRKLIGLFVVFALTVISVCSRAGQQEYLSTPADRQGVSITLYNQNMALVKDMRHLVFKVGLNNLVLQGVSGHLRPETTILRSISHRRALRVVEQNFDFDILTPEKLLEKFVGKMVTVIKTQPVTGEETTEKAYVLSTADGVVLRIGDRIETGVPGRLVFPKVPAGLRAGPALTILLNSRTDLPQLVELSYLTGGLTWRADYVAELNRDDNRLGINGWVTITNNSGTAYKNAAVQLVAGKIHTVAADTARVLHMQAAGAELAARRQPLPVEEKLGDYHLYSLPRPVTILDKQSKQVALLEAGPAPCRKEYQLRGQEYYYRSRQTTPVGRAKVEVFLSLRNSRDSNMGMPLPQGVVRVFKRDKQGGLQFVGEDRLAHTPENKKIRLKLGEAFDVTAVKKQTDFKKIKGIGTGRNYVFESAYRLDFANAGNEEIIVKVIEPLPGDWKILEENLPHQKETAATAVWFVKVPARGDAILTYRARVRY